MFMVERMKVLFVNVVKDVAIQRSHYPLSFGYLVAYCRERGLDFQFYYSESVSGILLTNISPDVVCFTCTTENFNLCKLYAQFVKRFNSDIKVIIGGVHVSAVPNSVSVDFDCVVVGEGEQTFYELAKNGFVCNSRIKGLYYDGCFTGKRELIEPLDMLPFPDRSLFSLVNRLPYVLSSRGCSFACKFCSSKRFWERVRLHSAERFVGEVLWLKKHGVKHVIVFDDNFALDVERVSFIADYLEGSGLSFAVNCRSNQISDSLLFDFKRMGVISVGMGLESNSERILEWLGKGNTPSDNERAVKLLSSYSIPFVASFIRGVPIETDVDLKVTFDFIKRFNVKFDMYDLMRFPNTEIYDGSRNWDECVVKVSHKVRM